MNSKKELHDMDRDELVTKVLQLQKVVNDMGINEAVCSQVHNYHFASNEILRLNKEMFLGSAIILGGFYSLSGVQLVKPITLIDGLGDSTINGLLDDIQTTFDHHIELIPTLERRNIIK